MVRKTLPGTRPLRLKGDLAARMVASLQAYLLKKTEESVAARGQFWQRDFSSPRAYARSVEPNRERLRRYLGVVEPRVERPRMELVATTDSPAAVAEGDGYTVLAVRWPVLDGVDGEGLLLEPTGKPVGRVVALPDADQAPEVLVGLAEGLPAGAQFARRLAENGCQVVVPALIDRGQEWSGNPRIGRMTQQPHREWIYRMAYELGRHPVGYEVQQVLAAVDWFRARDASCAVGVVGYGEGGMVALHAAALDPRVSVAVVSGYFREREALYAEPIYRNVWRVLQEFGDAGIASLIAPRPLVIEASRGPTVGQQGSTPGTLEPPPFASTKAEVERVEAIYRRLGRRDHLELVGDGTGPPGSEGALGALLRHFAVARPLRASGKPPADAGKGLDPRARLRRQFDRLVAHTQALMRRAERRRGQFWSQVDKGSLKAYEQSVERYRETFSKELIGELPPPSVPPRPRTRRACDEAKWTGYETVLDVWPGVFAHGILLVPRDIGQGERRPCVVCQHGLEGRPRDLVARDGKAAYHRFAAKLADRGFVVFAPQNPYIGGDDFRVLQRLANPLGCTLFSIIVRQHEVLTDWLAGLPFVDGERIGFYGLSYGGKTAMRVPPLVRRYCLSICSGDFNEWLWKNVSIDWRNTYMFTGEYEMYEWD
ncbi:MAG: alpha/beta hydrolase family protein, partial [Planctomycetota bacterium]